jgi:hypothetical protein
MTENQWRRAGAVKLQEFALARGASLRKVQLLAVACGDAIWADMNPAHHIYFEALRRTVEGLGTPDDERHLSECGPYPAWLDWCLMTGRRAPKVKRAATALTRDVYGNPLRPVAFDPAWRTDTAVVLARQMYDTRAFGAAPILADALQDAGCEDEAVLLHLRDAKQVHVRGCWVVDHVLNRA